MSYPNQVIYQQVVRPPGNGNAVAALVLGIVAIALGVWVIIPLVGLVFAFLAFLPGALAVVFGHIGVRRAAAVGGVGRGQAIAGLALGYVTVGLIVVTTIFWILAIAGSAATSQYN